MKVTNEHFKTAVELHSKGVTNKKIASILGLSESTVSRFLKCDSFDDYREITMRNALKVIDDRMEHMSNTLDDILSLLKKYMEVRA